MQKVQKLELISDAFCSYELQGEKRTKRQSSNLKIQAVSSPLLYDTSEERSSLNSRDFFCFF